MINAEEARKQSNIKNAGEQLVFIKEEIDTAINKGKYSIYVEARIMKSSALYILCENGYSISEPHQIKYNGTMVVKISWRDEDTSNLNH